MLLHFLPCASFEIFTTSQDLIIMILNFLVFLQNINIAHKQFRSTHLKDIAFFHDIFLLVFIAIRHRLDQHIHSLAHLIRHQSLNTLLIVECFEVPCFYQFPLFFVLSVFKLVQDWGFEYELITNVR